MTEQTDFSWRRNTFSSPRCPSWWRRSQRTPTR